MPLNYERLMSMQFEPVTAEYSKKDTILYALGLGVGAADPFDSNELKYVYERGLVALPMLAVTLGAGAMRLSDPSFGVNYTMLLHGEQTLQVHKPLPAEGTVISESKIDEIYDKGAAKGAVMYLTRKLFDKTTGDLLVTMCNVVFLRADGGFGGKSEGAPKLRPVPGDRPADASVPISSTRIHGSFATSRPARAVVRASSGRPRCRRKAALPHSAEEIRVGRELECALARLFSSASSAS